VDDPYVKFEVNLLIRTQVNFFLKLVPTSAITESTGEKSKKIYQNKRYWKYTAIIYFWQKAIIFTVKSLGWPVDGGGTKVSHNPVLMLKWSRVSNDSFTLLSMTELWTYNNNLSLKYAVALICLTTVVPWYRVHFWQMGKKYVISKCPLYKGFVLIQILEEINIFELNIISRFKLDANHNA